MKRDAVSLILALLIVFGAVWLAGCASINKENVDALTTLVDNIDARGVGSAHDPTLKFFVYHESGVGVRVEGVHLQGSGQGTPPDDQADEGSLE